MVAQEILDLLVWVRALVPEPFFYLKIKTSPSQGEIMGSIPIGAATKNNSVI